MNKNERCTKSLLIKEATKQFSADGFAKASIRSICRNVKVSIAAINYHFGNKNNLIQEVVRNSIANFNQVIDNAESEFEDDFLKFLENYAHSVNKLESETIIIFREVFHNRTNTTVLDEMINSIQHKFNKTAMKVAKKDSRYINSDERIFNDRVNIFISLVVMEVIRKALLPSHINNKSYSPWIKNNIKLIFPKATQA